MLLRDLLLLWLLLVFTSRLLLHAALSTQLIDSGEKRVVLKHRRQVLELFLLATSLRIEIFVRLLRNMFNANGSVAFHSGRRLVRLIRSAVGLPNNRNYLLFKFCLLVKFENGLLRGRLTLHLHLFGNVLLWRLGLFDSLLFDDVFTEFRKGLRFCYLCYEWRVLKRRRDRVLKNNWISFGRNGAYRRYSTQFWDELLYLLFALRSVLTYFRWNVSYRIRQVETLFRLRGKLRH